MLYTTFHLPKDTKFKELARVYPLDKATSEVQSIINDLNYGAPNLNIHPLETLVVSVNDKWRMVIMRVKGQTWIPVARWRGKGRRLDSYTILPDDINHGAFSTLDDWCGALTSEASKRVVYLQTPVN